MIPINLAIEDELSEAVLKRLLAHAQRDYHVGRSYGRTGYGYLRKTIGGWNQAARGKPFIVLTDLDRAACPPELIRQWLSRPQHPNLLLRVAIREVESWLLADSEKLPGYLNIREDQMPDSPDTLADAKQTLVNLARKSRSVEIRSRIVPKADSTAKQGPDYNACLCSFVGDRWDVDGACQRSPSLRRTVARLATFKPVWNVR
jgi:hypothetical protein